MATLVDMEIIASDLLHPNGEETDQRKMRGKEQDLQTKIIVEGDKKLVEGWDMQMKKLKGKRRIIMVFSRRKVQQCGHDANEEEGRVMPTNNVESNAALRNMWKKGLVSGKWI